jgi:predicted ribosome quality control (RQC) complex YloA/Tae2 family protein
MEQGQLVLTYAHRIAEKSLQGRWSDTLDVPELGVTIPLDPRLNPADNAAKLFHRYKKLRDARRRIPLLIAETEREAARLDDLVSFAHLAQTEADLRDLRHEFNPPVKRGHGSTASTRTTTKRKGPVSRAPSRYRWGESVTAIVGRNARENDEVTFRLARRDDLWLHARERTGAHVILEAPRNSPGAEAVEAAAQLAAYFSDAREDAWVDVDTTAVKHVRKVPGGAPGRVTYREARTIRVRPALSGWVRT